MGKMWKWLAIAALVALVAVGAGLGVSLAKTSGYLADTRVNLATTQANLTSAQATLASTQANLTSTQNDLKNTQSTLASTQSQLKTTQDTLTTTSNNLKATQDKLTATQNQLTSTQGQLAATSQQLADIQKVYPLKNFPDLNALKAWLAKQTIVTFSFQNTFALQEAAAKDGWLISAGIWWNAAAGEHYSGNTAILANGDCYMFYCDDHTLYFEVNIYD